MASEPKLSLRHWLAFWGENVKQSVKAASEQTGLASFVILLLSVLLGAAGMSAITTSRIWTALGAPLGLLAWFLVLMLFVTPAKMSRAKGAGVIGMSNLQRALIRGVLEKYHRPSTLNDLEQYRYFVIFPVPGAAGATELAAGMRAVFGEVGYDAQLVSNELPGVRDVSRFRYGIWVRGSDAQFHDYAPPTVDVVKEALQMAAIEFTALPEESNEVELIIGASADPTSDEAVAAVVAAKSQEHVLQLQNRIHELEARSAPRRLSASAATAMQRTIISGLANHWKQFTPDAIPKDYRFTVSIISVGRDRETLDYRADRESADGRRLCCDHRRMGPRPTATGTIHRYPNAS